MSLYYLVGFSLVVSVLVIYTFLGYLRKLNMGQTIRVDGPQHHQVKAGTPTMGGIAIFTSLIILSSLFVIDIKSNVLVLILGGLAFCFLGAFDDYLKITRGKNDGIKAKEKLFGQLLFSALFMGYLIWGRDYNFSHIAASLPTWLYFLWGVFIITGASNAVNLTDGLDGLATGTIIISFAGFAWLSQSFSDIFSFLLVLISILFSFLLFNYNPAKLFMGDAGSLSLGALLAMVAIITRNELYLLLFGITFVWEVLSVIIQVSYFKKTKGKRIFKMSPFHHHLEYCGWNERKVVWSFYIFQLIFVLLGCLLHGN